MGIAREEFEEELAKSDSLLLRTPGKPCIQGVHQCVRQQLATLAQSDQMLPTEARELHFTATPRRLDYTSFFFAIYEIVDSWSAEVDAESYAKFLWLLHSRITGECGKILESLDDVHYCAVLESFGYKYDKCTVHWDKEYIGGVGMNSSTTARSLKNYSFSDDGSVAYKSNKGNLEKISVIKSLEFLKIGKASCVRVLVECYDDSLSTNQEAGDVDIGITTIRALERGSRVGDDLNEFCVTSPRPLGPESRAQCYRTQLCIGDVVTLNVSLIEEREKGILEILVNGNHPRDETGSPMYWEIPIVEPGYDVVAAVRTPGVAVRFLED